MKLVHVYKESDVSLQVYLRAYKTWFARRMSLEELLKLASERPDSWILGSSIYKRKQPKLFTPYILCISDVSRCFYLDLDTCTYLNLSGE